MATDDTAPGPVVLRLALATVAAPMETYRASLELILDAVSMELEHLEQIEKTVHVLTVHTTVEDGERVNSAHQTRILKQRSSQLQHLMEDAQIRALDRGTATAISARVSAFRRLHAHKGLISMACGVLAGTRNSPPPEPTMIAYNDISCLPPQVTPNRAHSKKE
jgi:hypothetical protein